MVLHQIFQVLGKPLVDVFASDQSHKKELFLRGSSSSIKKRHTNNTVGQNQILLMSRVVEHMKQAKCSSS